MIFTLIIVGVLVGIVSTLFGIGGGIIIIPSLYTIFPDVSAQVILASSLGIIFINSIINNYNFYKSNLRVHPKHLLTLAIFISAGAFIGSKLAIFLPPDTVKKIFGITLLVVATKTLLSRPVIESQKKWSIHNQNHVYTKLALMALIGGTISGLTGLGGGIILVPLFLTFLKMPYRQIPIYSNACMTFGTLSGVITYMTSTNAITDQLFTSSFLNTLQFGYVNVGIIMLLATGSIFSSRVGVKIGQKISPKLAKNLFAALLYIAASKILFL